MKSLIRVALASAALVVAVQACAPRAPCTPSNCSGCCDESELCLPGNVPAACGKAGSACISCAPSSVCSMAGRCFEVNSLLDAGNDDVTLSFDEDGGPRDAGAPDAGSVDGGDDAGVPDSGVDDAGLPDAGALDAGADAGAPDAGAPDAGPVDAGTPDAGAPDAGAQDAGTDAGPPDAGAPDAGLVDAGTDGGARDAGIVAVGTRFANFSAAALDFCLWNPGNPVPSQAAFHPSGVAPGTVSNYFPFPGQIINFNYLIVPPGVGCVTDAGFNTVVRAGNSVRHRTEWYTGTGSPFGGGAFEDVTPNPAMETVLWSKMLSINAQLFFLPDSDAGIDAGAAISISATAATLLPAGVPGFLVGTVPSMGTPPPRPFVGQDGGVVRIFMTGSEIVVCDNLAAPLGDQSDCRPSVRAP